MIQKEPNMVKNANWPEANQLANLQAWPRIWTRNSELQRTNPARGQRETRQRASELQVQRSTRSATLPPPN